MAMQDLYKTAQQSAKLLKIIREGDELESWVSSKIIKAAADIESVYQYLNFEKHFKEQERAINNNENLSEAIKSELLAKLAEAKDKVAKMKKKAAKEKEEKMDESKGSTSGLDKTKGKVTKSERSNYFAKSTHGNVTKGSRHQAGEGESDQDLKDRVERDVKTKGGTLDSWRKVDESKKCTCETKGKTKCVVHGKMDEAKDRVMTKAAKGVMKYGKDGMKALAKAGKDGKDLDKVRDKYNKYDESKGSKPDFLDLDKDGNKKEPMKKAAKDVKSKKVEEGSREMTGSARDKVIRSISSKMKDTPQPQRAPKNQEEADSWARMKRDQAAIANIADRAKNVKEAAKDKKNVREAIARAQAILEAKAKKPAKKANKDYDGDGKVESPKDEVWGSRAKAAAKAGHPFKESINESAELDRLKYLTNVVLKG